MKTGLINRDNPCLDIPLKKIDITGRVCGTLAQIDVKQIYENNGTEKIETIYIFPVQDSVSVTDFSAKTGDKSVNSFVMEKEEAMAAYQKTADWRESPFLTRQQPPNVLQIAVGELLPGETAVIHVSYIQEFRLDDHQLRITVPSLLSPDTDMYGTEEYQCRERVGYTATLNITIDLLRQVLHYHSPSHAIKVDRHTQDKATISLAEECAPMDRDFVLICACREVESSRGVAYSNENAQRMVYLTFVPDIPFIEESRGDNYIFLVDISGSMAGEKLAQIKSALNICLRNLSETDTFSMAAAGDQLHLFSHGHSLPFTQVSLDRAAAWIEGLKPAGKAEIFQAIRYSLPPGSSKESIILLFTDNQTGNQDTIISYIKNNIGKNRIFVFGIKNAAGGCTLEKIAQAGRGRFQCVCPGEGMDERLVRQFVKVTSPLCQNIQLDWTGIETEDVFPGSISSVFDMEPVEILARFSGPLEGDIMLRGNAGAREFCMSLDASAIPYDSQLGLLEKIWAKKRIAYLEDVLSYTNAAKHETLRNEIIKLSKSYNLASSLTSFVAVNVRPNRISGLPTTRMVPVHTPVSPTDDMACTADHNDMANDHHTRRDKTEPMAGNGPAPAGTACMFEQIPVGSRLEPLTHRDILRILARNQQANGAFSPGVQDNLLTKIDTTALVLIAFTVGDENIRAYRKQLEKSIKYLLERIVSGRIPPQPSRNSDALLKTLLALKLCLAKNIPKKATGEWISRWIEHIKSVSQVSSSLVGCQSEILRFIDHDILQLHTPTIRAITAVNEDPSRLEEQIVISAGERNTIPALARLGILKALSK